MQNSDPYSIRFSLSDKMLEELTRIDALTGLGNSRCSDQSLASVWNAAQRRGSQVSMLMVNVDFFKPYNDHLAIRLVMNPGPDRAGPA